MAVAVPAQFPPPPHPSTRLIASRRNGDRLRAGNRERRFDRVGFAVNQRGWNTGKAERRGEFFVAEHTLPKFVVVQNLSHLVLIETRRLTNVHECLEITDVAFSFAAHE